MDRAAPAASVSRPRPSLAEALHLFACTRWASVLTGLSPASGLDAREAEHARRCSASLTLSLVACPGGARPAGPADRGRRAGRSRARAQLQPNPVGQVEAAHAVEGGVAEADVGLGGQQQRQSDLTGVAAVVFLAIGVNAVGAAQGHFAEQVLGQEFLLGDELLGFRRAVHAVAAEVGAGGAGVVAGVGDVVAQAQMAEGAGLHEVRQAAHACKGFKAQAGKHGVVVQRPGDGHGAARAIKAQQVAHIEPAVGVGNIGLFGEAAHLDLSDGLEHAPAGVGP
ncbi:hypothetical protein DAPPUDRAFT_125670, partial [Daphnia pulex]